MERGRLYYHYLDEDEIVCEPDGEGYNGEALYKLCVVGDEERIEIRSISAQELTALRDMLSAVLQSAPSPLPPPGGDRPETVGT
jgi:hypothetical protein